MPKRSSRSKDSKPIAAPQEQAVEFPDVAATQLVDAARYPPRQIFSAGLNGRSQSHWPRNLEDMQGTVRNRAHTLAGDESEAADVQQMTAQAHPASGTHVPPQLELPLRQAREVFERAYFEKLLARGSVSLARLAQKSGLGRTHLYRKLKALGIKVGKKNESP